MKIRFPFLALLATAAVFADQAVLTSREWTLRDGSKAVGRFVRIQDGNLILKKDDREVPISREELSPADWDEALALASASNGGLAEASKKMAFALVSAEQFPQSTFEMGAPRTATARQAEEPNHRVKISRKFFLKRTEVTWTEWNIVRELSKGHGYPAISVGRNGYQGDASGKHPVTEISWIDAILWCNLKSQIEHLTPVYYYQKEFSAASVLTDKEHPEVYMNRDAEGYRLPTEAEWELAWWCGGGTGPGRLGGWSASNSSGNTHPVGTADGTANTRFHDMLGNVAEWCWDRKGPLVGFGFSADPTGAEKGDFRIFRGGSWADTEWCCFPSYRGDFSPNIPSSFFVGFRPARNPSTPTK